MFKRTGTKSYKIVDIMNEKGNFGTYPGDTYSIDSDDGDIDRISEESYD